MSGQAPISQDPGYNVGPYNPQGGPNWQLQPLAQMNQSVQALVQAVQAIYQQLGGTRPVPASMTSLDELMQMVEQLSARVAALEARLP